MRSKGIIFLPLCFVVLSLFAWFSPSLAEEEIIPIAPIEQVEVSDPLPEDSQATPDPLAESNEVNAIEDTSNSPEEVDAGTQSVSPETELESLSVQLATEVGSQTVNDVLATEMIVLYELDVPIVIPLTPLRSVTQEAVPEPTFVDRVIAVFEDLFSGEDEPAQPQPVDDEVEPASTADVPETISGFFCSLFTWCGNVALAAEEELDVEVEQDIATTSEETVLPTESDLSETNELSSDGATSFVSVGTTSIPAEIVVSEYGEYTLHVAPGVLPPGIHEIIVATTTPEGEINERFVVDIGGGAVRQYQLDEFSSILITENEEGYQALWWWVTTQEGGVSVTRLAEYGTYQAGSPLGYFNETVFFLSHDIASIMVFDTVSRTIASQTIGDRELSLVVGLRNGRYYVSFDDLGFQFVSVPDTIVY